MLEPSEMSNVTVLGILKQDPLAEKCSKPNVKEPSGCPQCPKCKVYFVEPSHLKTHYLKYPFHDSQRSSTVEKFPRSVSGRKRNRKPKVGFTLESSLPLKRKEPEKPEPVTTLSPQKPNLSEQSPHVEEKVFPQCQKCKSYFVEAVDLLWHFEKHSLHISQYFTHDEMNLCPVLNSGGAEVQPISKYISPHKRMDTPSITPVTPNKGRNSAPYSNLSRQGSKPNSCTATQLAYNGTAYECYLCHRIFSTLDGLNSHLNMAVHKPNQFKCLRMCGAEFQSASVLVRHFERDPCNAVRFRRLKC